MTSNRIQGVLGSISKLLECAICLDLLKNPVTTKCNHSFCRFCLTEFLKNKKSVPCPLCNEAVTKRSLQDQDRLNEIVTHVRGLIAGYQQDTGEFFSPPRVNHDVNAFFPSTPEAIFSQREQVQNKRQTRTNSKNHTQSSDSREDRNCTIGEDDVTSSFQEPEQRTIRRGNKKETITRTTTRKQRTRSGTRLATGSNKNSTISGEENHELPALESRTNEKSRDEIEKEEALLKYLDQGSCGVARSEDEEDIQSLGTSAMIADHDLLIIPRSSRRRNEEKDYQRSQRSAVNDSKETGNDECHADESHERMEVDDNLSVKEMAVDGFQDNSNPVCVLEKMKDEVSRQRFIQAYKEKSSTKEEEKHSNNHTLSVKVDQSIPKRIDILELTPEIEYEGEECDLGDDLPLFQSQEVKAKEKSSKVKLNIYSGKKLESVGTRNQGKQKSRNLCQENFDDESMLSFSESPVERPREFQSLCHVKTYSKTALQKNKKSNMVKQWVKKAQTATGNNSFSESDSQFSSEELRLKGRHKKNDSDFDNFGFNALEDSTPQNDISEVIPKRKKIFKTKVKEASPETSVPPEGEPQNSDPYEFKSSGTAPTTKQKRGKKKAEPKKAVATKLVQAQKEVQKDALKPVVEEVEELNDADAEVPERRKSKKEKHVHFAVKSPEQELTHLMEKIGAAEDHDFLFSTQEAKSSMAELEEEEEEEFGIPEADIETVDDDSQVTAGSVSEKSQSISVVPPTPLMPVNTKKFQSPPKILPKSKRDHKSKMPKSKLESTTPLQKMEETEKTQSLSMIPPTPLLPIEDLPKSPKKKQGHHTNKKKSMPSPQIKVTERTQSLSMIPPTPVLPIETLQKGSTNRKQESDITSVPQTPLVEMEDIHLTDSESCSQMPLPIPRRKKDSKDHKCSGPSQISPTPIAKEGVTIEDETEYPEPDLDDSSSTEDLNITSDHTQFEEADLEIQPEEVRKQLSQMSEDSGRSSSQKTADARQLSHNKHLSMSSKKALNNINETNKLPTETSDSHPEDDDDELTVVAGTVESIEPEEDMQQSSKGLTPLPKGNDARECINSAIESSLDIIGDTMQSSGRSTRSNRSQAKPAGRRQRITKKISRKNKIQEDLIEVRDSDEEHIDKAQKDRSPKFQESEASTCPETQTNMSDKIKAFSQTQTAMNARRNSDSTVQVDSQASTIQTSLENLQDVQTLPPEDVMDGEVMGNDDDPHSDVVDVKDNLDEQEDTASNIPETITESVSLLEPLCEEQDEDEVQLISEQSVEPSTLESVSILHEGEPLKDEASVEGSCKPSKNLVKDDVNGRQHMKVGGESSTDTYLKTKGKQKRKREDESAEDASETPAVSMNGSLPVISSAPVTIHLDDSDEEMTVVRRPKRKCFSLEGSPLKAKAKSARARLSRKVKPAPKKLDQEICPETECETMEIDVDLNEEKITSERAAETITQDPQSELQLVNTLPQETQMEQSMEDIFNKNTEDVAPINDKIVKDVEESSDDDVKIVSNETSTITPQRSSKLIKLSKYLDSDSDSDDAINTGSVRKGVRAARGLASHKKKLGKSAEASQGLTGSGKKTSEKLEEPNIVGSQRKKFGKSPIGLFSRASQKLASSGRSNRSVKNTEVDEVNDNAVLSGDSKTSISSSKSCSQSSRRKLSLDDSEFVGPTPTPRRSTSVEEEITSTTKDGDVTIVLQSPGSEMSGRSQKKMKGQLKGDNYVTDCHVGLSPSVEVIEEDDLQILPADLDLQDSSSDEEFVLRDDDEVIRKAEMPTVNDIYSELPKSSPPACASSPRQQGSSGSDVAPTKTSSRKQSRCPVISDSDDEDDDSDDESIHSNQDEQMNCTSSSAFSSQSEMLTTQQQGRLEKDVEKMRERIRRLEALKDAAGGADGSADGPTDGQVLDTEECSKETPNTIPPSNMTKTGDDDESSSDGELFLSPLSPSPPPPKSPTPEISKRDRKSQQVADAFEIIEKYRSPNLTKSKEMIKKLCEDAEKKTKVKKIANGQREIIHNTKEVNQSDLPLGTSPTLTPKQIKTEQTDHGRKVLSPLVFENKGKKQSKLIVMITSGLAREQMVSVQEFVSKTGNKFFPKFNKSVTHVILKKASGHQDQICDRTLKFFLGVVAKCWVLSFDWVRDSLLAGKPVPEESYEMVGDTVSVENHYGPKRSRLTKKKLFSGFAFACIGVSTEMTKDDMRLLLELGGAQVAEDPWELGAMKADVPLIIRCLDFEERPNQSELESLNNFYKHFRLVTISREWVLDSISSYRIQPLKEEYIINTNKNIVLPF